MRLTKAKFNNHGGWDVFVLDWNEGTKSFEKKSVEDCKQAPLDEQAQALAALVDLVTDLCEFPKDWADSIDINGFSIHWQKNEHFKVAIQGIRHLKDGGPLVVNTPKRNVTAEDDEALVLTDGQALTVEAAMSAAMDYFRGDRKAEPLSEKEAAHRTAYAKGEQAYEDGEGIFQNPYDEEKDGKDAVNSWIQGFTDAEQGEKKEPQMHADERGSDSDESGEEETADEEVVQA